MILLFLFLLSWLVSLSGRAVWLGLARCGACFACRMACLGRQSGRKLPPRGGGGFGTFVWLVHAVVAVFERCFCSSARCFRFRNVPFAPPRGGVGFRSWVGVRHAVVAAASRRGGPREVWGMNTWVILLRFFIGFYFWFLFLVIWGLVVFPGFGPRSPRGSSASSARGLGGDGVGGSEDDFFPRPVEEVPLAAGVFFGGFRVCRTIFRVEHGVEDEGAGVGV